MSKPRLSDDDYCRAAKRLGCDVSMIKAVADQESLGAGFDSQGRPKILFERHIFHKLTRGVYDQSHPGISNRVQGGYGKGSQYDRYQEAYELDAKAAMMAASWGKFQILGSNFAICGFMTVSAFVDAMRKGEPEQLDAFCEFVLHNHLDDELRRKDAAGFARGYNGPAYKKNHYDTLILEREKKFAKEKIDCSNVSAAVIEQPTQEQGESLTANPQESTEGPPPNTTVETKQTTLEAPDGSQATATVTTATTSEPVTVKAVGMSIWAKVVGAITALTGLGINAGNVIETKLSEITTNQIIFMAMGVALIILAIWYVKKRQESADEKTHALILAASDKDRHTVVLEK